MPGVLLEDSEWAQVMSILSTAPWRDANPLLMKIGEQLRAHRMPPPPPEQHTPPAQPSGNGQKEADHG